MPKAIRPLAVALCALFAPLAPALAESLPVTVANTSEPVLCAEKDNVTLTFAAPEVTRFTVQALHPSYMGTLTQDRFAPDWAGCADIQRHAEAQPEPKRLTLYESNDWQLIGYSFADFWRQAPVKVRVGERAEANIHLVQLWHRAGDRLEEVLVVYPQDGYWRAHPLPPDHLRQSSYGSSFLIGPIEVEDRPIVKVTDLAFDPATISFTERFADGNAATLKVDKLDKDAITLSVTFDRTVTGKPFAALRSMYVTEFNADAARVAARDAGAKGWREEPIMGFRGGPVHELWAGRLVPSRHNTSAPDMLFKDFAGPSATK